MAQLQVKDISPEFLKALKVAAAQQGLTLKDFVLLTLQVAILPPVVVGGTNRRQSKHISSASGAVKAVEIKPSGKHSEIQWGK